MCRNLTYAYDMTATMVASSSPGLGEGAAEEIFESSWEDHHPAVIPPVDSASIASELQAWNLSLARRREVPDDLRLHLEALADEVDALAWDRSVDVDPYLLISVQSALNHAMRLFYVADSDQARR